MRAPLPFVALDDCTEVVFLHVAQSGVVLFQAIFETYEGVATVRTLEVTSSLVCVTTTPSMRDTCAALLHSIAAVVPWQLSAEVPRSLL